MSETQGYAFAGLSLDRIAAMIDHTLLRADATADDIDRLGAEAAAAGIGHICVNSCHVSSAVERLKSSATGVCAVAGFPLGAADTDAKAYEAALAAQAGADEVDMVMNIGWLKGGDDRRVARDIAAVVAASTKSGATVKVIIETCLLSEGEKRRACLLAEEAGAAFVKTSTGFSTGGATVSDVSLLASVVAPRLGVKASGGIKDLAAFASMAAAGATRIGTSNGAAIIEEARAAGVPR